MAHRCNSFLPTLTPREHDVACACARGLRNREIASELGISAETVKRHLATTFAKLDISRRVELAIYVLGRSEHSRLSPKPAVFEPTAEHKKRPAQRALETV
jgi:DNA-binding NarL/FixJ family response regulator